MTKSWREQLTELGGYDGGLSVPARSVAKIIQELEDCREENIRLAKRIVSLESDVREANETIDSMEEGL